MFASYNVGTIGRYVNVPDAYRTCIVIPKFRMVVSVQKTDYAIVRTYCDISAIG
ncbi:uncharacterized protein METZ01_LOCUS82932 [marine metagenome]|uniref:Uncharacterized protein n=1 Tax=marine metagenome TaxID=408172 RepID=A0A381UR23_9ZZZZ